MSKYKFLSQLPILRSIYINPMLSNPWISCRTISHASQRNPILQAADDLIASMSSRRYDAVKQSTEYIVSSVVKCVLKLQEFNQSAPEFRQIC